MDNVVQVGREDLAAKEGHTQIVAPGNIDDRKTVNVFSQGIGIDPQFRQLLLQIGMVPDAPAVMEVIPNFWRDIGQACDGEDQLSLRALLDDVVERIVLKNHRWVFPTEQGLRSGRVLPAKLP